LAAGAAGRRLRDATVQRAGTSIRFGIQTPGFADFFLVVFSHHGAPIVAVRRLAGPAQAMDGCLLNMKEVSLAIVR
jgi:hypothetical protein